MSDTAFDYLDWPAIEGIVCGDTRHPRDVLKPRLVREGVLIQGFFPEKTRVNVIYGPQDKTVPMALEDESGYFAAVIPERKIPDYYFEADGEFYSDLMRYPLQITAEKQGEFSSGVAYDIYKYLGAHPKKLKGVKGTFFAVWAPNAARVSVVGDFNDWDGRMHLMECHEDSGIFELFIPEVEAGELYKFELLLPTGEVVMKTDPFGSAFEKRPGNAAIVTDLKYRWHDRAYLEARRSAGSFDVRPLVICETLIDSFMNGPGGIRIEPMKAAADIVAFAKDRGYTHIELLPVMEYPDDISSGYQTSGYYAPTSRYGTPNDFKVFVDELHRASIGVIVDWTPSQFASDRTAMAEFDGTCLYEHLDPRQGIHPMWGSRIFNYGRPQVRNFLIANALFWFKEYHVDGLRLDGVSTILRLDYGRTDGQWIPNLYGSYENLDGVEFLKHLNSIVRRQLPDVLMIAEEDVDWPDLTGEVDETHLGFDYKWQLHFTNDLVRFLTSPAAERPKHYDDLTAGLLYNYLEKHIISLSRDLTVFEKGQLYDRLPEKEDDKAALLRAAYVYLFTHPGKKLLAAGEEFDSFFFTDLIAFYKEHPALYAADYREAGFEWINAMDAEKCVVAFMRRGESPLTGDTEDLLVICHFSSAEYPRYRVGVPCPGIYEEIFNTDSEIYGGFGDVNRSPLVSEPVVSDGRKDSVRLRLAPYAACVLRRLPDPEEND